MRCLTVLLAATASAGLATADPTSWVDLFTPPTFRDCPVSIMTGISCPDAESCFVTGGTSTQGFSVYKANLKLDPAFRNVTRQSVNMSGTPLDMLTTMAMQNATHGVAGGVGFGYGGVRTSKLLCPPAPFLCFHTAAFTPQL